MNRNAFAQMIRKDPRKAAVLGVLVLVMVGLWAKIFFFGGAGPARASAAPAAVSSPQAAESSNSASSRQAAVAAALGEWLRAPIAPVSRNLFAVKFDYFPQDGNGVTQTMRLPSGDGFWDMLAKSMSARADQKKERQIFVENLQLQAAQLKLQTTVMGAQPTALINGRMVAEGDVVAAFRIEKIEARRIIVEREGIRLEITMK